MLDPAIEIFVDLRIKLSGAMRATAPRVMAAHCTIKNVCSRFSRHSIRSSNSLSLLERGNLMNRIVYIVGAVVIIIAVLSFFGL